MVVGPELAEQLRQLLTHVRNINVEDAPQCAELQHTDVQALSGFYKVRLCSAVAPATFKHCHHTMGLRGAIAS